MSQEKYKEALEIYSKTILRLKFLMSLLSNDTLIRHYSHSVSLKRNDAAMMALVVYMNMTFCFQMQGGLEEIMICLVEAEECINGFVYDSSEGKYIVARLKELLSAKVGSVLSSIKRGMRGLLK